MPRSRSRRTRDPTSGATPVAQRGIGVTRISFGAQSLDAGGAQPARPAPLARPTSSTRSPPPASGRSARSASTCSTTCPARRSATWTDSLERALALAPDHLSLYALTLDDPDAEGLTGPDGDHLPTTRRRPALARAARGTGQDDDRAAGDVPLRRRIALPRPASAATRSATGPGRATRAGTTWPTGSAARTRRSGPARTPSTAPSGAGTPPVSTATSPRSAGRAGTVPALPPGGVRAAARLGGRRGRGDHPRAPRLDGGRADRRRLEPPVRRDARLGRRGRTRRARRPTSGSA